MFNDILPKLMLGRHEFFVDFRRGEFRSVSNPDNTIELFKLELEKDKFLLWFDNAKGSLITDPAQTKDIHAIRLQLPIRALDPDFFKSVQQDTRAAEELVRSGKSVYNQPGGIHSWEGKSAGPLPVVNLYGTDFFVDLRVQELRQVNDLNNKIPWRALDEEEFHFNLWYNTKTKNEFIGTLEQAKQTEGVKLLVLPPLDKMIRDGIARHQAMSKAATESTDTGTSHKKVARRDTTQQPAHRHRKTKGI
jgi:hypothetical protein